MIDKKLLIVSECFYPEEFKINELAYSWIDMGFHVDVITLNPTYPLGEIYQGYENKLFSKINYNGINIYRVYAITGYLTGIFKKIIKYLNFMLLGSIFAIIYGRKYDYVFGYNLGALTDMIPAYIIKKLYNKKIFIWVQDIWPDSVYAYGISKNKINSYLLEKLVPIVYGSAHSIFVSSKGFIPKIEKIVSNTIAVEYFPNWADELNMELEPAKLCNQHKIHFTFAGNLGKMQNLENIIHSFSSLQLQFQNKSQLNIIGSGSNYENLKNISKNNKNIIFHDRKERSKMASYFKASDFLIISLIDKPIFNYTVPAKTQTYIAAKKPILAFINGETADIVKNHKLGLCANPSDIKSMRKVFERCIDLPVSDKLEMIKNCDKLNNSIFNKTNIIDNITYRILSSSL